MSKCMQRGVIVGAVGGGIVGLLAWLGLRSKTDWAMAKRVGLPLALSGAVGLLVGFAAKTSCESGTLAPSYRGLPIIGRVPSNVKCPKVKGVPASEWARGVKVEMEHTGDRDLARCIAAAHFEESGVGYYRELLKMERRLKHGG